MKNNGGVTVITQAFNEEQYIEKCIQSVLNQTYSDFEYVLIDNGSTDRTGDIIEKYALTDKRIRVLHNPIGAGYGYEYWILNLKSLVSGEYFASLDGDDWIDRCFLETCVEIAEKDRVDIVATPLAQSFANGTEETFLPFSEEKIIHKEEYAEHLYEFTCLEALWGKLYRRSLLTSANFTSVRNMTERSCDFGSDGIVWWELLSHSNSVCLLPKHLHRQRVDHDVSVSGYYKRFPTIPINFGYVLQKEEKFLLTLPTHTALNYELFLSEYMGKMSDCLCTALLNANHPAERLNRIADIYLADAGLRSSDIKRYRDNITAEMFQKAGKQAENEEKRQWMQTFYTDKSAYDSLMFSLSMITYLENRLSATKNESNGLNTTITNLEKDRLEKDQALSKREKTIRNLSMERDEKDAAIQRLVTERDEKDAGLARRDAALEQLAAERDEKDATIQRLVTERDEKDVELGRRDAALERLAAERDEKDAAIQRLVTERDEKDAELGRRDAALERLAAERDEKDAAIQRLVTERDEKDAELGRRDAALERLAAERDEKEATIQRLVTERDEKDMELVRRDAALERLAAERDEKDATIQRLVTERDEKDMELGRRDAALERLAAERDEKDAELGRKIQMIQKLMEERDAKEVELERIYQTFLGRFLRK